MAGKFDANEAETVQNADLSSSCQGTKKPGPNHFCNCNPPTLRSLPAPDSKADIKRSLPDTVQPPPTAPKQAPPELPELVSEGCDTPGEYKCAGADTNWILVCDASREWITSAYCGAHKNA